jgi:hypothetical protein
MTRDEVMDIVDRLLGQFTQVTKTNALYANFEIALEDVEPEDAESALVAFLRTDSGENKFIRTPTTGDFRKLCLEASRYRTRKADIERMKGLPQPTEDVPYVTRYVEGIGENGKPLNRGYQRISDRGFANEVAMQAQRGLKLCAVSRIDVGRPDVWSYHFESGPCRKCGEVQLNGGTYQNHERIY